MVCLWGELCEWQWLSRWSSVLPGHVKDRPCPALGPLSHLVRSVELSWWEIWNPQRQWSPVKLKSAPNVKIPSYTGKNWVKHFIFENGVIPSLTVFVPPISVLFMWVSYSVHLPYSSCTHSTLDGVQRVGGGKNLYKKCIELYKPLW